MKSHTAYSAVFDTDEEAIRSIHYGMIDAWNARDAAPFIAPFSENVDFVAAPRARDSMQLTAVTKRDGEWRAEALMNA
jgi:hypothetical protein